MLSSSRRALLFAAVLFFSIVLNSVGINWGVTGLVSWQPDSIEGSICVFESQKTFGTWTHKYPRGHFLVNNIFYAPLIKHWEKSPVRMQDGQGRQIEAVLTIERLTILAKISRWIAVAMSLSIVWAVMTIAYYLFEDFLAAILSGLALAFSCLYVFFSHTGTVDIPSVFWFSWACFFGIRTVSLYRFLDCILLGFCAGWLICTKEGNAMYLVGLGLSLWAMHISQNRKRGLSRRDAFLSFVNLKTVLSIVSCMVVFLILNGFLAGPDEFMHRVASWKKVTESFEASYKDPFALVWQACTYLYYGLGWPFLFCVLAGVVYFIRTRRVISLFFGVLPLIFYYILTISQIHFVAPRFLLCAYPGLCLLIGKTAADGSRCTRIPKGLRYGILCGIYGLSLMYCIGLNLELLSDTRQRAEQWIHQNVPRTTTVASAIRNPYAPRLHLQGYKHIYNWVSLDIPEIYRGQSEAYPEYLILSHDGLLTPTKGPDTEFRKRLFANEGQYSRVVRFDPRFVYPARTVWAIAGWGLRNGWVSPDIHIFKKKESQSQ